MDVSVYIGRSSGKQDHYNVGLMYGLSHKNLLEFKKMYPGYFLEVPWKLVTLDLLTPCCCMYSTVVVFYNNATQVPFYGQYTRQDALAGTSS